MKKATVLFVVCFILFTELLAQDFKSKIEINWKDQGTLKTMSTPTLVVDTLHYYFNKHYMKTGSSTFAFPYFKSPSPVTSSVTHCGSRFDVPAGETVTVTGLETFASMPGQGHHANTPVPLTIYLCYLNNNGLPEFPMLDSVTGMVGLPTVGNPTLIGGNFANAAAYTMTNNFAVLVRCVSPNAGDTVHVMRTDGVVQNSGKDSKLKYSDSYGFVRYGGFFYSTKDFTQHPGFGQGTDYEFIVAPRVKYFIQAGHKASQGILLQSDNSPADTMCTRQVMTFTNTSSPFYEHRMYNLNAFHSVWNLNATFPPATSWIFSPDSAITWNFEFYDNPHHLDSRVFLPYHNNGIITAITDSASFPDCFRANEFRARLRPMGLFGRKPQYSYSEGFTMCLKYCNGDGVGVTNFNSEDKFKVYPNPMVAGKSGIRGLTGKTTLFIYSGQGTLIQTQTTEAPFIEIDLIGKPNGIYFVKLCTSNGELAHFRLIKPD